MDDRVTLASPAPQVTQIGPLPPPVWWNLHPPREAHRGAALARVGSRSWPPPGLRLIPSPTPCSSETPHGGTGPGPDATRGASFICMIG